jgi:NAD(P)-dependent dehydrogenase (short-subunit alcohol dehydrogenase family)
MIMAMNETKVWFITGASSGFGRALAEAALERGDRVVATARDPGRLSDLAAEDGVYAIGLDVTDREQRLCAVDQAVERFGRIDVLVNNAGRTQVGAVEETSDEELRSLFELHFFAPVALTRGCSRACGLRAAARLCRCPAWGVRSPRPASACTARRSLLWRG